MADRPDRKPSSSKQLREILETMVRHLNTEVTADQIRKMTAAFTSVYWEFPDHAISIRLVLETDPPAIRLVDDLDGEPGMRIVSNCDVLHDAAWRRRSLGAAFIAGKLNVRGLNPLHLRRFVLLIKPLLASYRNAEEDYYGTL